MKVKIKYDAIRRILITKWDPIGVADFNSFDESNETEYNSYAGEIYNIVCSGAGTDDIEKYLSWAETYIGAGTSPSRIKRVAKLIFESREPV